MTLTGKKPAFASFAPAWALRNAYRSDGISGSHSATITTRWPWSSRSSAPGRPFDATAGTTGAAAFGLGAGFGFAGAAAFACALAAAGAAACFLAGTAACLAGVAGTAFVGWKCFSGTVGVSAGAADRRP